MAIYELEPGIAPLIAESAWIAESAEVMGRVTVGDHSSIWFATIIRGDTENITIGERSNIQDGCILHADLGAPLLIGHDVTVGHRCVLHGCTIGDGSLIGIGAIILNSSTIGKNCLVGAGSLITENKTFPDNSLIMGSPAKVIRGLTPLQITRLARASAHYVNNSQLFRTALRRLPQ